MEKKIPQKAPYVLEMEPGTYAWCSCGASSKQPFCDGSHKGSEFTPTMETIEEKTTKAWCGCKCSESGSFCDGAHKGL